MRRAHGGRSSVGRVLGCDPSCRGFEPRRPPSCERPLISSNESRGRLSYIAVFRTSQYTPAMSANLNDLTSVCVHCGFCLPACPTYALTGDENDSPRGRIHLIRQVLTSQAQLDPAVAEHVDSCLGCLSCVSACPSGVQYDRIIEEFRPRVEAAYAEPRGDRMFWRLVFALFPHPLRLRIAALGAVAYRRTGGAALIRSSGLLRRFPRLGAMEALMPPTTVREAWRRPPARPHPAARAPPQARGPVPRA